MKQKNELKSIKERNLTTGWLLCAAVVFSGLLPVSASGTASSYEIEGVVLKITVPEGVTNEVDVSELACANDNIVTEIRKLGRGGFLMNDKTAIPNYTGDIYVDQGTWIVACTNANSAAWRFATGILFALCLLQLIDYAIVPIPDNHVTKSVKSIDRSFLKNRSFCFRRIFHHRLAGYLFPGHWRSERQSFSDDEQPPLGCHVHRQNGWCHYHRKGIQKAPASG